MAFVQQPLSMEASPSPLSSRPGFPVTQHRTRQRVRLSVRKGACSSRNPPTSTGNPGERTRISCYAAPKTTSCAAFIKESRMSFAEPIGLNRKSGAVEGSAVLFLHPTQHRSPGLHRFSCRSSFAASATCSGVIVSRPASGSACREWSRLLSGCRSTREGTPKGPFRRGSVGP